MTAYALFDPGSFFDLAQSITQPNDTVSQTLCQLSPISFQRLFSALRRCEPDSTVARSRRGSGLGSGGPIASEFGLLCGRGSRRRHASLVV
jgi:hypothetical protein